jgi:hypothetical protein
MKTSPSTEQTKDPLTVIQASLDALREVERKATPGPWTQDREEIWNEAGTTYIADALQGDEDGCNDAALIKISRNSLLPLIEAVEKLTAAVEPCPKCNGRKGFEDTTYDRTGSWVVCATCCGNGRIVSIPKFFRALASIAETLKGCK